MKSYSELIKYHTYRDRLEYLMLYGKVGKDTFGWDRYLNQALYKSPEWKAFRNKIILRDNACDLGIEGMDIGTSNESTPIYIHHINPITKEQIVNRDPCIFSEDNVICCSYNTHQSIHYGVNIDSVITKSSFYEWTPRTPNDTCPWKKE